MRLIGSGRTDVGRRRDFNEDSFKIDLARGLFVLADGMGGHAAGEVASRIATETVSEFIERTAGAKDAKAVDWPFGFDSQVSLSANRLRTAARMASDRIFRTIEEHPEMKGMGTTLVSVLCEDRRVCVAHIGDSRAYFCRNGQLAQLTDDHSWVGEQVRLGNLSPDEATKHPFRNVITRALGSGEDVSADLREVGVEPGDRLLLCTDGLTSMLDDRRILESLQRHSGDLDAASDELIERANEAGGEDNITVIVAAWRP